MQGQPLAPRSRTWRLSLNPESCILPPSFSPRDAIDLQRRLRERVVRHTPDGFQARLVAGADISIARESTHGYAGVVVIEAATLRTVDEATAAVEITFPYIPGLLSFRELPAVARAWDGLTRRPDVLIFDGVGYAHPRRFGLACHGGVLLGVPSIGCAKSILVGHHPQLGAERGSTAPLVDRGEVVGMAVRTRANVRPVYVSVGHLMDLPTAVSIVLSMTAGYREPETTRRAHRLVNELRRSAE
jgi:deoxyribonuclease V